MSTLAATTSILTHLERLIDAMEIRTSAQTSELMALVEAGVESREVEQALWRNIDNLLALRRQQMHAGEMLVETAIERRRDTGETPPSGSL
nr:hypothetical protein [Methylobacterium sp. L1A1]